MPGDPEGYPGRHEGKAAHHADRRLQGASRDGQPKEEGQESGVCDATEGVPPPQAVAPAKRQGGRDDREIGQDAVEIGDEGQDAATRLGGQGGAQCGHLRDDQEAPRPDQIAKERHPMR